MKKTQLGLWGLGLLAGILTACGGSSDDEDRASGKDAEEASGSSSRSDRDSDDDDFAGDDDSAADDGGDEGSEDEPSNAGAPAPGGATNPSGTSVAMGAGAGNQPGAAVAPPAEMSPAPAEDGAFIDDGDFSGDDEAAGPDFEVESGADVPADDGMASPEAPIANTNVNLGGSQDFGFFRGQLDAGMVPEPGTFDASGFFAEHHTKLPLPDCGNRVCLQAMVGVMGNLLNGQNCTMLQLGLNSPIAANPDERPPLTLAVVVDTSGSMNTDNKIQFVRDGLELMIDGLKDEDRFALITYDTNVNVLFPLNDVSGNRVELRDLVQNLEANGSTNIYDGLEDGYREVFSNYDSARQNRVILLSDGNPTVGVTDVDSILDMSEGYNSAGVGLTTVGLGTDFNFDLMRNLALQADGNFYYLENAGAVDEVFDEELSFFTVPIAFDLKLNVRAGDDYEFGRAVGSPLWEDNGQGGSLEVPSVFIAHRESDDDVTDQGGRRGGGSALLLELMPRLLPNEMDPEQTSADIAVIDVEFREPGSDEVVQDTVVVNYPGVPWETPDTGYFANANNQSADVSVVTKSFVMLNVFVGLEQAVAAYHENGMDPSQSLAELEALLAALYDYNEEVQDTDIEFDIALVEQLMSVMIANNVPEPSPELIDIPVDPWPAD